MPRRPNDASVLTVALDETERDFADLLKAASGLGSDANLVRTALYRLAVHLDVPVSIHTFGLRSNSTGRRRPPGRKKTEKGPWSAARRAKWPHGTRKPPQETP